MGKESIGIVILAAGGSSRLGKPKQLLPYQKSNLLQHTIDEVAKVQANIKVLILGGYADKIKEAINPKGVRLVFNAKWDRGMATSLKTGLEKCLSINDQLKAILFVLSDQPYLKTEHLQKLIEISEESNSKIICSSYGEQLGVPAIFKSELFPELSELKGDKGAKKLINTHPEEVTSVFFEKGEVDIDTPDDYDQLLNFSS